jgi:hypothetical protein
MHALGELPREALRLSPGDPAIPTVITAAAMAAGNGHEWSGRGDPPVRPR